jgi:plastocyanin
MQNFKKTFSSVFQRIALVGLLFLLYAINIQSVRASTQATTIVNFANFAYNPAKIYITAGDTVNWQGTFSMHPLVSDDGLWAIHSSGTSFNFVFDNPGVYLYHCNIHGAAGGVGMSGQVIVTGPFTAYIPLIVR